MGISTRFFFL